MMPVLWIFLWWLSGAIPFLLVIAWEEDKITIGHIGVVLFVGWMGLIVPLACLFVLKSNHVLWRKK